VQSTSCGRSSRNYPHLVAQHYRLHLTDVTCGAAVIPNVIDTAQGNFPPQLTAVKPDTKLVTVTVGGNDINYNATALTCGVPTTVCTAPAELASMLTKTRAALPRMIQKIKAAAPSATIVFVTYPREFLRNCPALSYTDGEAAIMRSMGAQLERVFLTLKPIPGLVFVDPYAVPGDHTACAVPSQRWTAGHRAEDGFAYHPTALGHQVMADMIVKALGERS
jgi:lysophospholipase L1-like esterase